MSQLQGKPKDYLSPLTGTPRFQIRIMSDQPTLIQNKEEVYGTHRSAVNRAYVLARRTSYMVNGPNREVKVSIEIYHYPTGQWETVFQAKTRLREGGKPI